MRRRLAVLEACLAACLLSFGSLVVAPGCGPSRPPATEVAPQQSRGLASTQGRELPAAEPEAASSRTADDATTPRDDYLMKFEEANGHEIYQRYCLVCHGADGDGVGFNAYNLNPRPRSLIDQHARERLTDEELARAISLGGAARNKSPLMPRWGYTLNTRQIRYIIAYIRLLQRKAQSAEAASEPPTQALGRFGRRVAWEHSAQKACSESFWESKHEHECVALAATSHWALGGPRRFRVTLGPSRTTV